MITLGDAIQLLEDSQVNLQLEFSRDKDDYVLFELRCLPWRNSPRSGYMILVAEQSMEAVLKLAAEELEADRWTVLNWKVKLNEPGRYFGYNTAGSIKLADTPAEQAPQPLRANVRVLHTPNGVETS